MSHCPYLNTGGSAPSYTPAACSPFRICLLRRQIPGPAGRLMAPSLRSRCFGSVSVQCQGYPQHMYSLLFFNTLGKDSAAEAAVRLMAKSLRSEGASIQCSCNARVVLFVLFTGGWEPNQSQISVNQFIIKCIVPNLSFKQQIRNRWFHNWLIISTLEHSRFPTSPLRKQNPGTSMT